MASVNKVILVGNLGRDPEVRYTPNNDAITNITIATTERYKDKSSGENKEITEWHRIVFFNRLAEVAGQYLKKGSAVYVEGRLRTRKWTDNQGQERYTTEIVGDSMQMLGSRQGGGGTESYDAPAAPRQNAPSAPAARNNNPPPAPASAGMDDMDDDIPF